MRTPLGVALAAMALATFLPPQLDAQTLRDRVRQRTKDQVERRIEQRAEQAVEKSMDRTEDAIRCVVTDTECITRAGAAGREIVYTDERGNVVDAPASAPAGAQQVGEGAWANYDFVPGDRVLFAEDFSADRVGNFPRRIEFRSGNMEVVEWQGGRYLRSTAEGAFEIVLSEALPDRFTIEFDLYDPDFYPTEFYPVDPSKQYEQHTRAFLGFNRSSGLRTGHSQTTEGIATMRRAPDEAMARVSMIADGPYVKLFLDETRIANVPSADLARSNRVRFSLHGKPERPVLLGNIRVAAGSTSLFDRLQAGGSVATQGILFDVGSDRIRPESTPTLREIGEMLRQHPELRLRIEGHTDATGSADANLQLSERRAAAVRRQLVAGFGIAESRLEAVGKGQTEPVGSNDTPEGRQNNRRVVLVKL